MFGDSVHDSDKDGMIHKLDNNNLTMWAAAAEYRMKTGATAMDAIHALPAANGMTGKKKYGGTYLASVTTRDGITLGEFTNGKNSGWLYRVNGTDPGSGSSAIMNCRTAMWSCSTIQITGKKRMVTIRLRSIPIHGPA